MTRICLADLDESGTKICQNLHQPLGSFRRIGLELAEKGGNERLGVLGAGFWMRKDRKGIIIGQRTWSRCNDNLCVKSRSKRVSLPASRLQIEQQAGLSAS